MDRLFKHNSRTLGVLNPQEMSMSLPSFLWSILLGNDSISKSAGTLKNTQNNPLRPTCRVSVLNFEFWGGETDIIVLFPPACTICTKLDSTTYRICEKYKQTLYYLHYKNIRHHAYSILYANVIMNVRLNWSRIYSFIAVKKLNNSITFHLRPPGI